MKEVRIWGADIILDICFGIGFFIRGVIDEGIEVGAQVSGAFVIGNFDQIKGLEFENSCEFTVGIGGTYFGRRELSSESLDRGRKMREVTIPRA